MLSIPQTNPGAGYRAHRAEIDLAIQGVLESGWYVLGNCVNTFEREFSEWLGCRDSIGVASGTDALVLAMKACGIGPGDLVATVSHTAVATVAAVELCGARPLLIDIDPSSLCMAPDALKLAIVSLDAESRDRLKAVVPVHLYGQPADMEAIATVAGEYGLTIIEDCAQAHGASIGGRRVGTFGSAGAFSFYPTKNLGCFGDGGMVCVTDPEIASRIRSLREYGWVERYISAVKGQNSRLDEIQAAVLSVKLKYLEVDNASRRRLAALYDTNLAGTRLTLPVRLAGTEPVFHQYVVRTRDRDSLREHLRDRGIGSLVHYPVPVHLQPAYAGSLRGPLTITEQAARSVLSLPMYPELSDTDCAAVCSVILEWDARAS